MLTSTISLFLYSVSSSLVSSSPLTYALALAQHSPSPFPPQRLNPRINPPPPPPAHPLSQPLSHPKAPYTWLVRDSQHQYIQFTRFGRSIPEDSGNMFLTHLISDLTHHIRTRGPKALVPAAQTISWDGNTLELVMYDGGGGRVGAAAEEGARGAVAEERARGAVAAVEVLDWVRGLQGFMRHYGYVEAEMRFLTWRPGKGGGDRVDGWAGWKWRG
ncbi:MAG: hypothetical protein Q9219_005475 [cf. Caloplaca sp. 3 TL-2023]